MISGFFINSIENSLSLISILMITALAALISERAGIINIGLEGQMVFAAFGYSLVTYLNYDTSKFSNHSLAVGAILVGISFGFLMSLLHSLMVLKFKINHIISGTVINVFAPAIAIIGATLLNKRENIIENILYIPYEINGFVLYPIIVFVLGIVLIILLNFSRFGLRLRSVGENPVASESVGVNALRYQFLAISIAGILTGLSGSLYVITQKGFMPTAGGYGFIAIAIMILAHWNGWFIMLHAFIVGYIINLTYEISTLTNINYYINPKLLKTFIYLSPLLALLVFQFVYKRKNSGAPEALGVNYISNRN